MNSLRYIHRFGGDAYQWQFMSLQKPGIHINRKNSEYNLKIHISIWVFSMWIFRAVEN